MGKTSLVRELLRRLTADGEFEPIFVDLEDANTSEDAVAEIAVQSRRAHLAWDRIKSGFVNVLRELGDRVDSVSLSDVQVKLRAGSTGETGARRATRYSPPWPDTTGVSCSQSTSSRFSSTVCSRDTTTASPRREDGLRMNS